MRRVLTVFGLALAGLATAALLLVAGWRLWPDGAASLASGGGAGRGGAVQPEKEPWLVSPTGGAVAQGDVQDYLTQDRSTPGRALDVTLVAPLDLLLSEGETLPEAPFIEALADIRAPVLAEHLCPILTETLAERCSVASAGIEEGSFDPGQDMARFRLKIRYSQESDPDDLPDLARHVLDVRSVALETPADAPVPDTAEASLRALIASATAACAAEDAGLNCRVLRLTLTFEPGKPPTGQAVIGSLRPLPKALRPAPELIPAPGI